MDLKTATKIWETCNSVPMKSENCDNCPVGPYGPLCHQYLERAARIVIDNQKEQIDALVNSTRIAVEKVAESDKRLDEARRDAVQEARKHIVISISAAKKLGINDVEYNQDFQKSKSIIAKYGKGKGD